MLSDQCLQIKLYMLAKKGALKEHAYITFSHVVSYVRTLSMREIANG